MALSLLTGNLTDCGMSAFAGQLVRIICFTVDGPVVWISRSSPGEAIVRDSGRFCPTRSDGLRAHRGARGPASPHKEQLRSHDLPLSSSIGDLSWMTVRQGEKRASVCGQSPSAGLTSLPVYGGWGATVCYATPVSCPLALWPLISSSWRRRAFVSRPWLRHAVVGETPCQG